MTRRDIFVGAGGIIVATAADATSFESAGKTHSDRPRGDGRKEPSPKSSSESRAFNGIYHGDYLNQIAFPLGGIGAGMFCLEGTGALTKFSLRNQPDLGNEPHAFSAVCIKGSRNIARVLEGPIPLGS